ncbi:MAG: molybdopterin-dependent oxidoreductase [Anaerolineae bacterium]|nr:molybdopterin-dependent oxidoreductase [Anaerolineae bacterium]
MTTRLRILWGAFTGALLTASLLAVSYAASMEKAFGFPFIAYDVFDWLARNLPGKILTFGIDTMVDLIIAFNVGETDDTAKLAERWLAVLTVFGGGVVLGTLFFVVLQRFSRLKNEFPVYGLGLGLVVGFGLAVLSNSVNVSSTADSTVSFIWIVGLFALWGTTLNWVYTRLLHVSAENADGPSRRQFLIQVGGATATITLLGAGLAELLKEEIQIEGGDIDISQARDTTALAFDPAPGTRPEYTPLEDHYRIDINSGRPPVIEAADWRLKIGGLVHNTMELSLDDLRNNYEPVYQFVTLSCISNRIGGDLISTTRWTGVPLHMILDEVGLKDNASHLLVKSADNFFEYVDIELVKSDPRVMLTYEWDGVPLPEQHGFPLRIYIPDRYGMKQPKWITEIEVVEKWEAGYWVRRGWSRDAIVRATSVVDTVATDSVYERRGAMVVPVGGIAYAGARSVSKVEVRVDGGEWSEAQLREPLSNTTWVLWRYDWPFHAGEHTFEVRCVDGENAPQIEEKEGVRPDGATGIHARKAEL